MGIVKTDVIHGGYGIYYHFQQYFSNIGGAVSFIGGGNQSIQ